MNFQLIELLLAQANPAGPPTVQRLPPVTGAGEAPAQEAAQPAELVEQWDAVLKYLQEQGMALALNLVAAIAIFIVGRWVAKLIVRIAGRIAAKANVDETLIKFISNLGYTLLLVLVIVASLERMGVDTTSFAAILAAAGLAVGLALQGSLSNFAAGVMLILFKPFKVGDFVEAGGSKGVVEEILIFNTLMRTGDNVSMIIPNNQITSGTITNFSAKDTRRIDLVAGCGYGDDLKAVKGFLLELVNGDERILKEPEPVVAVNELGDSSVNFVVRPWVNSGDYWDVRWQLTEAIKVGFDERGFNIPYPSQDIHIHKSGE